MDKLIIILVFIAVISLLIFLKFKNDLENIKNERVSNTVDFSRNISGGELINKMILLDDKARLY